MSTLRERAIEALKIERARAKKLSIERQIELDKKNALKLKREVEVVLGEKISGTDNEVIIDGIIFCIDDSFLTAKFQCPTCKTMASTPIAMLVDLGVLIDRPELFHTCNGDKTVEDVEFVPVPQRAPPPPQKKGIMEKLTSIVRGDS